MSENKGSPSGRDDMVFVSSAEMRSHKEGMGIWVPERLERRFSRQLIIVGEHAEEAPKVADGKGKMIDNPEHWSALKADDELLKVLKEIEIEWNWVKKGKPLPQPAGDPNVFEEISNDEIAFIVTHLEDGTEIPPKSGAASSRGAGGGAKTRRGGSRT